MQERNLCHEHSAVLLVLLSDTCVWTGTTQIIQIKRFRISYCSMVSLQEFQKAKHRGGIVPELRITYPSFKMILSERNFIKQQDYSWKAKCCCASRDKLVLSWKHSLHYPVNKSLPLCSILSQTNAVNINLMYKCPRGFTTAANTLGPLYCLIYDLLNAAVNALIFTASKTQHFVSIRSFYYTLHALVFQV